MSNATLPSPPTIPRCISVPVKFVTLSTVGTFAWMFFLSWIGGVGTTGSLSGDDAQLAAAMCASGLVAAAIYFRLPDRTVDIYHRFGKGAALYFAVNVTVSLAVIVIRFSDMGSGNTFLMTLLSYWVISSLFVPGPYLGALVATRWSR